MERFRIEVGHNHGVKPGNIVGAIANEAGLDGEHIGYIDIKEDFSLLDLPIGMPREVFNDLRKIRVCGRALELSRLALAEPGKERGRKPSPKSNAGKELRASGRADGKKAKEKKRGPRPGPKRRPDGDKKNKGRK